MATVCIASSCAVRKTRIAISCKRATNHEPQSADRHKENEEGSTYTSVRNENLGERARMPCCLATHGLDGVNGGAGGTGRAGEHGGKPRRVEGCRLCGRRHGWMCRRERVRRCWRMLREDVEPGDEGDGEEKEKRGQMRGRARTNRDA